MSSKLVHVFFCWEIELWIYFSWEWITAKSFPENIILLEIVCNGLIRCLLFEDLVYGLMNSENFTFFGTHWEQDKSFVQLTARTVNISRPKVRVIINFTQQAYLVFTKSFITLLQTLMYLCVHRVRRTLEFPFRNAYCEEYSKGKELDSKRVEDKVTQTNQNDRNWDLLLHFWMPEMSPIIKKRAKKPRGGIPDRIWDWLKKQ